MSNQVRIDARELERIGKRLGMNTAQILNRIAFEVEGMAKQNAPVDTGALRNSLHTVAATAGNLTAVVADGVAYGIYQEFGTSRMAAQPFLGPAAEQVGRRYNDGTAWQELVK